ncbi:SLC13 family permease [Streptomyces sp. NPDC006422]|uniref:GntP family permease n=1 Tax=unclassified Streptomyces TaxID=2593676 RepID=UPI0033A55661
MTDTLILANTAIAVTAAVLLIVRWRVHPVIALLLASSYLGITSGLGADGTVRAITKGFGDLMAEIGLLAVFGVLTGALLRRSGAIDRLVDALLRGVGPRRMPYALSAALVTALQSIFLDVLVVMVAPLARKLGLRLGSSGLPRMVSAMTIGMEVGVVMVVPGIGCLAIAALMDVPLGTMLLYGLLIAVPTTLISVAVMQFVFRRGWWNPAKDELPAKDEGGAPSDPGKPAPGDELPGTGGAAGTAPTAVAVRPTTGAGTDVRLLTLFAPVLVALVLIATGAFLEIGGVSVGPLKFVCEPVVALLIGLIGTILVTRRAVGGKATEEAIGHGFRESGLILVLNGVGGSLALTIKNVGLGDILGHYFSASTVAPLLMVWVVAAVLHIAVGSVTLAAMTAVGILAPIAPSLGIDPVWIALAAGAGSLVAIHVTSNTFWLVQSLTGLTTRGTLKTFSASVTVAAVVAIGLIVPLAALIG